MIQAVYAMANFCIDFFLGILLAWVFVTVVTGIWQHYLFKKEFNSIIKNWRRVRVDWSKK